MLEKKFFSVVTDDLIVVGFLSLPLKLIEQINDVDMDNVVIDGLP